MMNSGAGRVRLLSSFCSILLYLGLTPVSGQISFEEGWFYPYETNFSALSLKADQLNRPFLYVASNEGGLIVLGTDGVFVTQVSKEDLGLEVMNLFQDENVLYLALGSHFSSASPAAIATIDIADPTNPMIMDVWLYETLGETNGMGALLVKDDLLYAGAMGQGLLILDVSDPLNLRMISALRLSNDFPVPNPANPALYNARGLAIRNNMVFITYDAGGLRVVDVSDSAAPREIGAYANPITYQPFNRPRAYNNIVIADSFAFIAVDYCGLEVLDITNPAQIELVDHYNPVNCPVGNWFNATVHTNELALDAVCNQLFVAAGRSELLSFDISDPHDITMSGSYGNVEDTMATWGLDLRNDSIFLGYLTIPIYVPFLHPFDAKSSGVKMIEVTGDCEITSSVSGDLAQYEIEVYPNPGYGNFRIKSKYTHSNHFLKIYDSMGRLLVNKKLDIGGEEVFELSTECTLLYFVISGSGQNWSGQVVNLR